MTLHWKDVVRTNRDGCCSRIQGLSLKALKTLNPVQEVVVTLHWKDVVRNDCGGCCGEPVWQPLARAVEAPSSAVRRISLRCDSEQCLVSRAVCFMG